MASSSLNNGHMLQDNEDNTFDLLLKEAKAKLRKRKVWHMYYLLVLNVI